MIRCALCLKKFSPDEKYHAICYDCFSEMGEGDRGSENTMAMCTALGKLVNLKLDLQDMKMMSDSAGGQYLLKSLLEDMDSVMKERLIEKELELMEIPLDLSALREQLKKRNRGR